MRPKRILFIDDEEALLRMLKKSLEITGDFKVETAANGKEGIKLARKVTPDLVVLDVMMPEMDGFEVLRRLKEDQKTFPIPVIMLSSDPADEAKIKAAQLYGEIYLTKPIQALDLIARINHVLARSALD